MKMPLLHASWALLALGLAGCPTTTDDDSAGDDDASADDDTTGDDDTSGDDDSVGDDDSAGDDDSGVDEAPDLAGWFQDDWGSFHSVDATQWQTVSDFGKSTYAVTQWDDAAGWILAQNGSDNAWSPDLWSRFDWVADDAGGYFYCQAAFDAATEADAAAVPASDATDPSTGGCGGSFPWTHMDASPGPVQIRGTWVDSWGGFHVINEEEWVSGAFPNTSTYHSSQYSREEGWMVAENDAGNAWNPGLWSRFDWTMDGDGAWWFCQTAYDAADEAAALATPAADPTDPATTGCGGFSWSMLTRDQGPITILGNYTDSWGSTHEIHQDAWTTGDAVFAVSQYSNSDMWIVAQNDAANTYFPGLWSRFDWTWDLAGDLWYCQSAYDAADETAALGTTPGDPTDPATTGCGGFSWTNLTP